jgi:hypothetical protein
MEGHPSIGSRMSYELTLNLIQLSKNKIKKVSRKTVSIMPRTQVKPRAKKKPKKEKEKQTKKEKK